MHSAYLTMRLGSNGDSGVRLQPVEVLADPGEARGEASRAPFGGNKADDSNFGWVAVMLVDHQRPA